MNSKRILVAGAGAIGGITAALMKQAGYDVTLVCKHRRIADIVEGRGLKISGICGEQCISMPAVADCAELEGVFDYVLIATKAYDMPECAKAMLPYLREDSLVLSLQNGVCVDSMADVVGRDRTVGCVVGFGATMLDECELQMTSSGEFIIGRLEGANDKLEPICKAMSSVVPSVISDDIYAELYSKLIVNSCITSLGAICGLKLGEMLKMKQARNIFIAIIKEAMDVANAMNIKVPPFGGKLDYYSLVKGSDFIDNLRRHIMIYIVGLKYRNLKSSSLQSLERGRPTEIDYFNGYIARKGDEFGVDCPVNKRLTAMIKEIEGDKRSIKAENLFDEKFLKL